MEKTYNGLLKVCFEAANDSMKGKTMTFINLEKNLDFRELNETPFKIRR